LKTTVLPDTSAGAIFQIGMAIEVPRRDDRHRPDRLLLCNRNCLT
jgi:hypothetical protein